MGILHLKPYRQKSKLTGLFEWVFPAPIEYKTGTKRGGRSGPAPVKMDHVINHLKA